LIYSGQQLFSYNSIRVILHPNTNALKVGAIQAIFAAVSGEQTKEIVTVNKKNGEPELKEGGRERSNQLRLMIVFLSTSSHSHDSVNHFGFIEKDHSHLISSSITYPMACTVS
jgi:hypothetical protein